MRVGGRNARNFRVKMVDILRRHYAGDLSLVKEIQLNFASDAPIAEMARDSLRNDPIPPAGIPAPVIPEHGERMVEEDPAPGMARENSGVGLGEKRPIVQDDVDRELEREERRIVLAERKNAVERMHLDNARQVIDHALATYKIIAGDAQFDQDLRDAIKETTLKMVKSIEYKADN
jgi:hypothetical protein